MNRISSVTQHLDGSKLLIPFFTVGYPDFETSVNLAKTAFDAGAEMVELGMPFSDPLADGPEIQYSSQVALSHGTTLKRVRAAVTQIRKSHDGPLIAMGYFNPVLNYGVERFMADFSSAGLDGLIIPDLPVEEGDDFLGALRRHDLSGIFLVAPTSDSDRIKLIDSRSTGFVYAVTVTGVTGSGRKFGRETLDYLKRLKQQLTHPFVAGFGVSSAEDAGRLTRYADGVVIGSALIKTMREAKNKRQGVTAVRALLTSIARTLP